MKKKIRICHHDTQGLHNDYLILRNVLESTYEVIHCVYTEVELLQNLINDNLFICNFNIFIEHIHEKLLSFGDVNIFIPNIEWFNKRDTILAKNIDCFFCKTKHAYNVLISSYKCIYTGFTSIDRYIRNIEKNKDYFLHLKGISKYKNSQVLIDTWCKHPSWPTLVVVHHGVPNSNGVLHFPQPFKVSNNIIVYQCKLNDDALTQIMNKCSVHICCSFAEGFGHYINEARSVGAYIVTTDGEPMKNFINENTGMLIKSSKCVRLHHGCGYYLGEKDIEEVVNNMIAHANYKNGYANREIYLKEKKEFSEALMNSIKMFL